jgi:hypothetical protein
MFNSYKNCRFDFNRLEDCLSWSGRAHSRYGNWVLKFSRPDIHPPWSGCAKPYMEITCSGRATVRTTVPHSPDAALKMERFLSEIFGNLSHSCPSGRPLSTVRKAPAYNTAVAHYVPQPINRGLWALRTARIWYWIPQVLRDVIFLWSHCKCVVVALHLKSILGVSPKIKDSIEDPFR